MKRKALEKLLNDAHIIEAREHDASLESHLRHMPTDKLFQAKRRVRKRLMQWSYDDLLTLKDALGIGGSSGDKKDDLIEVFLKEKDFVEKLAKVLKNCSQKDDK